MIPTHPLLDAISVRLVPIDALGTDAVLLLHRGLVLIDSGLCPAAIESIVDQVLARAAASLSV